MNRLLIAILTAALAFTLPMQDAEAKRLSGGGMKRSLPTQPAPKPPAQQPASPQQAAPAKPGTPAQQAAAPKRSWMGPIAGLAAGLGLAALASHLGFGEGLANVMLIALLAFAAFALFRFFMRRNNPAPQPQLAGAGGGRFDTAPAQAYAPAAAAASSGTDFDTTGFEKLAKQVFIRLQAANDAADQADLRRFTTPQMYASIQQELLERGGQPQRTEVLQLDANVVDVATEDGQQIVSVRFSGLVREQSAQAAEDFDEIWHLVRQGEGWLIAGIQITA